MIKKIFVFMALSAMLSAKLPIIVSIIPQKGFVEAIGGDNVEVSVMVKPGSSPHIYEPKPMQMKQVALARIYMPIGVEFEHNWLHRFMDLNTKLEIIDTTKGITRVPMEERGGDKKAKSLDPHIWTTPANVKIMARNILKTLTTYDPEHKKEYTSNYEKFIKKANDTHREILKLLQPLKGSVFMVFHPSWGYFSIQYGLKQLSVQIAGKSPGPRDLIALIKIAKDKHIKTILAQPETPDSMIKTLSDELKIPVIKISPMALDWSANLLKLAHAIAGKK